jgi:hypothetical protein
MRPILLTVSWLALSGCQSCSTHPPAASVIVCDGELDEPAWKRAERTGAFIDDAGQKAAPYSDARFVVSGDMLYVALYAADEDIRSSDAFAVDIGDRHFRFHPGDRGPDVGVDMDGTLDNPDDEDEEWVVEARIPLAALPHGNVPVKVARCDKIKDGRERCGSARITLHLP